MVRLPEERMMNRLLEQGTVSSRQIRELAGIIGRFHLAAATGPEIARFGVPEAVRANWAENFKLVEPFIGRTVTLADFQLMQTWVADFFTRQEDLLERRAADGFIREGDGDLHAGNICLTDPPVIFDCIEFNKRFRCLDTAADIAFLLMDLEYYRCGGLAPVFLDEYCAVTGDTGARDVVPFYRVYRAFIRGEVESIKAAEPELSCEERDRAAESARRHFLLARGLILRTRLPLTIFITCGLTGSGKSFLATELSFQLGLEIFSSDRVRKELAGIAPTARCREGYLHGIYHPDFTRKTYDRLRELANRALTAGRSVIIDATFRDPAERAAFRELAAGHHARFVILLTRCSEEVALQRLDERERRNDSVSDGRRSVFAAQKNEFVAPDPAEGEVIGVDTAESLVHTMDALLTSPGVLPCGLD
jgi:hypothetical protein